MNEVKDVKDVKDVRGWLDVPTAAARVFGVALWPWRMTALTLLLIGLATMASVRASPSRSAAAAPKAQLWLVITGTGVANTGAGGVPPLARTQMRLPAPWAVTMLALPCPVSSSVEMLRGPGLPRPVTVGLLPAARDEVVPRKQRRRGRRRPA